MKLKRMMAGCLAVCLLLAGCGSTEQTEENTAGSADSASGSAAAATQTVADDEPVTKETFAMDTYMSVTAYGENAEDAVDAALEEITRLDALLSIGSDESEISKLNASGSAALSDDTATMIAYALDLYDSTGGAFDITVLPLMELWGFTTEDYTVPSDAALTETLSTVGADKLTWDAETKTLTLGSGQSVDLGGIAKGYTSGRIMEIFEEYGVTSGMVSLGGNVHVLGSKPDGSAWRVGVRDPQGGENDLSAILEVTDRAVITSGGYERYFEEDGVTYHHILDPATGKPADSGLTSVTIVSEDGTLADGLSTSLFVMGAEKAAEYWQQHADEFECLLIQEDGTILVSEGLADVCTTEVDTQVISRS